MDEQNRKQCTTNKSPQYLHRDHPQGSGGGVLTLERFANDVRARGFISPSGLRVGPLTALCDLHPATRFKDLATVRALFGAFGQCVGDALVIPGNTDHRHFAIKPVYSSSTNNIKRSSTKHRPKKTFFNQLTITFRDVLRPCSSSIKLFSNGKVHFTGLKTPEEFESLADEFARVMTKLYNTPASPFTCVRRTIVMMNCSFKLNRPIQLRRMCAIISENRQDSSDRLSRWTATYDPEVYPALNARYIHAIRPIRTSLFVFGTGSVIIAAGKSLADLYTTYSDFCDHLLTVYDGGDPNDTPSRAPGTTETGVSVV